MIALVSGVILGAAAVLLIQSRSAPASDGDPVASAVSLDATPRVQALLEGAAWTSLGPRRSVLWVVGGRRSPDLGRFVRERAPRLAAEGVEVRYVPTAPADAPEADRALVAELWLNRDLALYRRWIDGVAAPPQTADVFRDAVAQAARAFSADLAAALGRAETDEALFVWRDGSGVLQVCACAAADRWRAAPDARPAAPPARPGQPAPPPPVFGPDAADPATLPPVDAVPAPAEPPASAPVTRVFPRTEPARPSTPRAPAPRPRPAPRTDTPRGEPEASRDEDSVFY